MRLGRLKTHLLAEFMLGKYRQVTLIESTKKVMRLTHETHKGKKINPSQGVYGVIHYGRLNYKERKIAKTLENKEFPYLELKDFK